MHVFNEIEPEFRLDDFGLIIQSLLRVLVSLAGFYSVELIIMKAWRASFVLEA